MKKSLLIASMALLSLSACHKSAPAPQAEEITPAQALTARMDTLRNHGIMFGHQDDPFYGITWQWERDRSDTRELVGDYPAVMGFDLGGIEMGDLKNLDSVPFSWIREEAIKHVERGGIITFSWHPRNPRTGGNAWDVSDTLVVRNLLKGGEQYDKFQEWMGRVATFLKTVTLTDGTPAPFIMRPWHEYNGSWFWWGQNLCTDEDFHGLWDMFQDYMNEQMPTNIVWSFSPNLHGYWDEDSFMKRYPGNDRVDLLGCDAYQWGSEEDYNKGLTADLKYLTDFADRNNLLFAMTECGKQNSPTPDWWSRVFLPLLEPYKVCYVLPWRNWNAEHFGVSKDASTADDFRQLCSDHKFQLLQDIK